MSYAREKIVSRRPVWARIAGRGSSSVLLLVVLVVCLALAPGARTVREVFVQPFAVGLEDQVDQAVDQAVRRVSGVHRVRPAAPGPRPRDLRQSVPYFAAQTANGFTVASSYSSQL
jgi:hypothetical protein